jgi:NAD+ synthase (glutamine-hydrolysing)
MVVQMPVSPDVADNLPRILEHIARAGENGADFVLFPEGALSGYHGEIDQARIESALAEVAEASARADVCALVGTSVREGQSVYNQVRVYDAGRYLGAHSKTVPTGGDLTWCVAGGGAQVFEARGLRFGCLICNDLWCTPPSPMPDPHLVQQLAERGAEAIFHSVNSGFDQSYVKWHAAHLETYARIHKVWIVTANAAGTEPVNCPSGVVGKDGEWVVQAEPVGEQVVCAEIGP